MRRGLEDNREFAKCDKLLHWILFINAGKQIEIISKYKKKKTYLEYIVKLAHDFQFFFSRLRSPTHRSHAPRGKYITG